MLSKFKRVYKKDSELKCSNYMPMVEIFQIIPKVGDSW